MMMHYVYYQLFRCSLTIAADLLLKILSTSLIIILIRKVLSTKLPEGFIILSYCDICKYDMMWIRIYSCRCWMNLYFSTGAHSCLEKAHIYFEVAVENMQLDLYAMFTVPNLLLDLGRSMEFYGSFKSSMETYSKIITNFPNFKGMHTYIHSYIYA